MIQFCNVLHQDLYEVIQLLKNQLAMNSELASNQVLNNIVVKLERISHFIQVVRTLSVGATRLDFCGR